MPGITGKLVRISGPMIAADDMLGVTMGPITGRLIADMMGGTSPALDPAPFRIDRF